LDDGWECRVISDFEEGKISVFSFNCVSTQNEFRNGEFKKILLQIFLLVAHLTPVLLFYPIFLLPTNATSLASKYIQTAIVLV
jgi:hypothetical protein